jgi:hypothetical protein
MNSNLLLVALLLGAGGGRHDRRTVREFMEIANFVVPPGPNHNAIIDALREVVRIHELQQPRRQELLPFLLLASQASQQAQAAATTTTTTAPAPAPAPAAIDPATLFAIALLARPGDDW